MRVVELALARLRVDADVRHEPAPTELRHHQPDLGAGVDLPCHAPLGPLADEAAIDRSRPANALAGALELRVVCHHAGVEFPGAVRVFRIRRDTFDHAGNRLSKEVVHGVTSLSAAQADPEMIARFVRRHWGIENKSHWVRDAVYREDHQHAYAGTGAQVMATLRNLALGLLRLAGITHITRTLQRIAADRTRIFPIIAAATSTNRL